MPKCQQFLRSSIAGDTEIEDLDSRPPKTLQLLNSCLRMDEKFFSMGTCNASAIEAPSIAIRTVLAACFCCARGLEGRLG